MPSLGRYELERLIASGGMAEVHLGHDKTLLRKVALKLPHPHLWQEARSRERFLQEGRIIAALSHEHIVHIYDVGESDGRLYLAMEFVAGESLDQTIQRLGPLPPLTVLALLLQILKGLQAAHAQGILHRDIKPANLLLTPQGQLKMADFGLSRLLGAQALSLSGQFIGTPRYTAPEVASGEDHLPQSDVFAAGMVALEMLTGHPVMTLENPQASLLAIREGRFASAAESGPSLPPFIQQSLQKLLCLDPAQRPDAQTALALFETYAWDHRLRLDLARIQATLRDCAEQTRIESEELVPLWHTEIQSLETKGQVATARKYTLALQSWSQGQKPEPRSAETFSVETEKTPKFKTVSGKKDVRILSRFGLSRGLALVLALVLILAFTLGFYFTRPMPVSLSSSTSPALAHSLLTATSPTPLDDKTPPLAPANSMPLQASQPSKAASPLTHATPLASPVKTLAPALLRVLTRPGYASVFIDGKEHGKSPTVWLALTPGRHQLRIVRPGCQMDSTTIQLAPAESLEVRRELTRLAGMVENPP